MAMGKPTDTRKFHNNTREISAWVSNVEREGGAAANWKKRWGWMAKEYEDLHDLLKEKSKKSKFLSTIDKYPKIPDPRSIFPVPETISGQYGWIPNKPEFKLEKWGVDVFQPKPLPVIYDLQTEEFPAKKRD